jgi:hypothetical protein
MLSSSMAKALPLDNHFAPTHSKCSQQASKYPVSANKEALSGWEATQASHFFGINFLSNLKFYRHVLT